MHFSPRFIFYMFFKRWKVSALWFLTCVTLAVLYVVYVPWKYQSEAQMVVKVDEQDILQGDSRLSDHGGQQASGEIMRRIINTHLDIFRSADVARETLAQLTVVRLYPDLLKPPRFFGTSLDAAIDRLGKDFSVEVAPNSNILQLTLTNRNPALAQEGLRTLISVFAGMDAEIMRNPRVKFLKTQLADANKQVADLQAELLRFKEKFNITSIDAERTLLLHQRDLLEQNLASENTSSLQSSLANAQTQLAAAEQDFLKAQQRWAAGSPILERAQQTVDLARKQFNTLVTISSNSRLASGLTALWTKQYNAVNDRLKQLGQAEGHILDLSRQLDSATQAYLALMQRARNAEFTQALNQQGTPNIIISEQPTLPYAPSQPRIVLTIGMSLFIGLFGGLSLCFFLQTVDETFGFADDVESMLDLPVIATLDYSRKMRAVAKDMRFLTSGAR